MTSPRYAAAEAELLRLEKAVAAISTNLVDLDDNPARKELDRTRLTGRTASAWAAASDALTRLWDGYRLLTELIARARAISGQRRISDAERAEFAHEVLGESITLSTEVVPLAQRGLLGPGHVTTVCTPAELLSVMEQAFTTAVAVAIRAGEVWDKMLPAAADAAAALEHVRRLGGDAATLAEADRRLGAFTATLAGDPLGVDERDLQAIRVLIDRADAERTSATELRSALEQRLADARRLLDSLAEAQAAAISATEAAAGRFLPRELLAVAPGGDLRPDLAAIEALAAAGHWSLISPRLADWTRRARERHTALREAAAHNAGLLAARNELRGRLDAYQAKALRRGLGEHPRLVPLHEAARAALWTAPCDLGTARAAVNAYQDALTATIARDTR
ncbi:hypothetical protein Ade02nite_91710 [Paractinoplanes deccanensis]|uniref:Uncharacterized protein n=1 Tax=Paractinoplanes deccanensis TaxID=113561 RepID=A0ABQ3YKR4_9ACTN|nr:hypothetical protein [Actinoplanes deccanensis]GID80530.1 hypothetical protein Ade02nite_91710 [Actinoplanes deccanensis]